MDEFDVIGFGALNVDWLFKVNRIAAAEEESFVTDFSEECGGSAANTMVGLSRLGRKVGFIGKVAKDPHGKKLVADFQKEGVNTQGITFSENGRSGKVMGFIDRGGQRALYVDPGVNDSIKFEEIDLNYGSSTKFLHLSSFVGPKSLQAQKKLVHELPIRIKVSLDPGALYAQLDLAKLEPIVKKTYIMMPNAKELALLTGRSDYKTGARFLIDKGVKVTAVKLGNRGCYVTDGKEAHLVKPFKVKVVDTTGAGDAFDAGFLYGLLSHKTLEESGRIGNFVASRCIMYMGARTGLPRLDSLPRLFSRDAVSDSQK